MSEVDRGSQPLLNVKRYAVLLALFWTVLIGCLIGWNVRHEYNEARKLVRNEAHAHFLKDRTIRHWAATHGGVYVPPTEKTPPNPHLSHIPDRDIVTTSGKKLTLMNPAYMLRQLMGDFEEEYGVKGHITSLKPLRPENAPDEWEREALESFEEGIEEVKEFSEIDGESFLRLMRPLFVKKSCLKCHEHQGYKESDVRGGVGVSVSAVPFYAVARFESIQHSIVFGVIWLIGISGIVFVGRSLSGYIRKQKDVEEALSASEKVHRELTENLPQKIFHKDVNGVYVSCNKHYADQLGISVDDIAGKTDFDFYPEEFAEKYRADDRRVMKSGVTEDIEETYVDDGQEIFIQTVKTPLRDVDGNVTGVLGIFWDITERKLYEQKLRQSEERFSLFMSNVPGVAFIKDDQGKYIYANEKMCLITNKSVDEILGATNEELFSPQAAVALSLNDDKVRAERFPIAAEESGIVDGERVWYVTVKFPFPMSDGCAWGVAGIGLDITDRKKIEEELVESGVRFKELMHQSPIVFELYDLDGTQTDVNAAYETLWGFSASRTVNKFNVLKSKEVEDTGLMVYIKKAYAGEAVTVPEYEFDSSGETEADGIGRKRWLCTRIFPLKDKSGQVQNVVITHEDVTDRKQAEMAILSSQQQLRASNQQLKANEVEREGLLKTLEFKNKELQDVVYTASHDLKSPLVNISGFSGHLSMTCESLMKLSETIDEESSQEKIRDAIENEVPEALGYITSSVDKMKSLIDGLLRISRIGTAEIVIADLDMNGLLDDVRGAMEFQLQEKASSFEVCDLPDCSGDMNLANQVFTNLIDNALKYREPSRGTVLEVSGEVIGGEVIYCVKDNGKGVAENHQDRIFEIFHRLNPSDDIAGEGLGLTIVTRIVDRLGGRIWLESEVGVGSSFFVALPKGDR